MWPQSSAVPKKTVCSADGHGRQQDGEDCGAEKRLLGEGAKSVAGMGVRPAGLLIVSESREVLREAWICAR